jgi:hypothetical protein
VALRIRRFVTTRADGEVDCRLRHCHVVADLYHDDRSAFSERLRFGRP